MRSLSELGTVKAKLEKGVEAAAVLEIITPLHPDNSGRRRRAGIDKRGRWCWYPYEGKGITSDLCSNTEIRAIVSLGDKIVEFRRGPLGVHLLYYFDEPWG